jgi:NADPH:quinone reductase-like Zn-dependent oxidoreductase
MHCRRRLQWCANDRAARPRARSLQDIAAQVAAGQLEAAPERVFSFNETREAHRVMDAGEAGGKCWSLCNERWMMGR